MERATEAHLTLPAKVMPMLACVGSELLHQPDGREELLIPPPLPRCQEKPSGEPTLSPRLAVMRQ